MALFALAPVASALAGTGIRGTVTEAEAPHAGIKGASVCLYNESFTLIKCEPNATSASGEYTLEGLTEGEYLVEFSATGFATQYYDDASSLFDSTRVHVATGSLHENINAALEEEGVGSITGRVTNSSGQGVGGIQVCANGGFGGCTETSGNGEYTISGLDVGTYDVSFSPQQNSSCEEEQGVKVRCALNANVIGQSVSGVHVKAGKTETVNVGLQTGGQISGTVTNASITHPGLAKVEVCALKPYKYEETEYFGRVRCGYTNASGQYTISGLESASYKVEFNGYICSIPKKGEEECPEVYVTEYYHGQQTAKKGEGVSVTTGSNTGGINESLREAFPTTPASTVAPTLTGTPAVGQALSCSQGSWSHEPTYVVYQWLRNGSVISGQTGPAYVLQAADKGHSITCSVTAGNGAGAATAMSNAVTIPVPLAVLVGVKVKGSVASVTLSCPGVAPCSGVMRIIARVAKHGKHKASNVTIGVASFSMGAGKSITLRVHLTGQGRKLLGKAGRRGLKVQITGSGVQARTATLKAGKHKK